MIPNDSRQNRCARSRPRGCHVARADSGTMNTNGVQYTRGTATRTPTTGSKLKYPSGRGNHSGSGATFTISTGTMNGNRQVQFGRRPTYVKRFATKYRSEKPTGQYDSCLL